MDILRQKHFFTSRNNTVCREDLCSTKHSAHLPCLQGRRSNHKTCKVKIAIFFSRDRKNQLYYYLHGLPETFHFTESCKCTLLSGTDLKIRFLLAFLLLVALQSILQEDSLSLDCILNLDASVKWLKLGGMNWWPHK